MAETPQLPAPEGDSGDEREMDGTGFYQLLVLFVIFAVLIAIVVIGSQGGAA